MVVSVFCPASGPGCGAGPAPLFAPPAAFLPPSLRPRTQAVEASVVKAIAITAAARKRRAGMACRRSCEGGRSLRQGGERAVDLVCGIVTVRGQSHGPLAQRV